MLQKLCLFNLKKDGFIISNCLLEKQNIFILMYNGNFYSRRLIIFFLKKIKKKPTGRSSGEFVNITIYLLKNVNLIINSYVNNYLLIIFNVSLSPINQFLFISV